MVFGFGLGLDSDYGPHWGFADVNGQLGGFDGSTLLCQTPAGAFPPECTELGNGRFRYLIDNFYPHSNPSVPYAPLELYLMGLIPANEVPRSFQILDEAELVPDSLDPDAGTVVVEAAGIREVLFEDIVDRHGVITLLAPDKRHFTAAFAVVSSAPAPQQVLDDVAEWAAAFGNRGTSGVVVAFETLTGGRAILDTELGPRREKSSPAPQSREDFTCSVLTQNCPRSELGCYGFSPSYCALSAGLTAGASCNALHACAPGLDCFSGTSDPNAYFCSPYCDPEDLSSSVSCQSLCTGAYNTVTDTQGQTIAGFCLP